MTKTGTPTTTRAPKPATTEPQGDGTKLAKVDDPASLTKADIQDIAKDDGTDTPENKANADAADALKQAKADAKGDAPERGYFHGQGGAAGL